MVAAVDLFVEEADDGVLLHVLGGGSGEVLTHGDVLLKDFSDRGLHRVELVEPGGDGVQLGVQLGIEGGKVFVHPEAFVGVVGGRAAGGLSFSISLALLFCLHQ